MSTPVESLVTKEYKYGFVTDIESDVAPKGLSEDIIRLIEAQGRTWFANNGDALIVADAIVFEFDGQGLTGIRSAFEAGD